MSARTDLYKIVEDGLCLGCGICAAIAPDAITIERGDDGDLRPFANESFTDEAMAIVNQICPSLRIEGIPPALGEAAPHQDVIWGPYHEMSLAYASEPQIRHEASTAGILTMLAIALVETGKVDGILHVKASDKPANFGVATISRNRQEILAGAGSRYGPTAALVTLEEVLSSSEQFAVVAKPCDLNALRNLAHLDKRVNERISYFLTMLCGGFLPDEAFRDFLTDHDLPDEGVSAVRYRGFGCPGPTQIAYKDGTQKNFHYLDFWGEDESQWSMTLRCKICPDGIGEAADIVAGDAWQGASPDREESETDLGFNSLITRTAKGQALYQAAIDAGLITKTQRVDCDFMSAVQPHQVTKKLAGGARAAGLRRAGSVAPTQVDLRNEALREMLGEAAFEAQEQGAYQRAMKAKEERDDNM